MEPNYPCALCTAGVSLLNQPGETTWPIAAMPMVFVRTDAVSMGATGARQRKAACLLWWPCDDFQGRGKLTLLLGLSCRPNWGKRTLPSP
eukprot:scaffold15096_cov17-Tisochrysis_lutea.AAC.4